MEKLTNIFSKLSKQVQETFLKYPITIILIYVITIFSAVFVDSEILFEETFEMILFIGIIGTIGVLVVETNKNSLNKKLQRLGVAISFIIAFIFYNILEFASYNVEWISRLYFAYISSSLIFIVYSFIRNSGVEFKEYVLKVYNSIFEVSIVYGILSIGFLLLSLAFIGLILEGEGWFLVGRAFILLFGCFYIPAIIHSLSEMKKEVSKFIKNLILYVLMPLTTVGMAIVYMYIFKVVLNGEIFNIPVFAISAIIFVLLYPICIMARNYKEESQTIDKVTKKLMYLYIPFIILEIYALCLRISSYGFTPSRYIGCVFVIYQLIFIILTLYKDSKYIKENLLVAILFICVLSITPLEPQRISNISQKKILNEYLESGIEFEDCSEFEKKRYSGAYQYLECYDSESVSGLSQKEKDELGNYNIYGYLYEYDNYYDYEDDDYSNFEYIYLSNTLTELDVSKYSTIYQSNRNMATEIDYTKFPIKTSNGYIDVNIEDYVKILIEEDGREYFKENAIIETNDEKFDIYITYIDISYDKENNNSIEKVILNCYVLEKMKESVS